MKTINVFHYDAFTNKPNMGNPAGIVLDADGLTEEEMQRIAEKVGFNETTFVLSSEVGDIRMRYFTPGFEMDLCGHGTVGTIFALRERGLLEEKASLTIETKAGILPIQIGVNENGETFIKMRQAAPQFKEFTGSKEELAHSIGLEVNDLDVSLPIVYGSTGNWTVIVPVKNLDVCERMKPNNEVFPSVLKEIPNASIHPICLETYDEKVHMHGRHFSSAYAGTIEDPVTGTASGVMGAYYATYVEKDFDHEMELIVEQGQEIHKDGRVTVYITKDVESEKLQIDIAGTAVYVKEFEVLI
ncbi:MULTISPECIES: PhzF family phenazine biosynthesis protein [Bacillus cereus group]|uniref:PhzF family phenazine biosynthesis isomerase n=1 Tax=Bacillus paranthracis TaxID=2026186 RepID=A0AAX3Q7K4_9BACI|nr:MULTISPECIES: PhzF family phenazine biosynthesis isomerase [Bacillus cereus group]MBE7115971.1 PhzF family phenazine biosynthesis isomerase [Bacillus paranthracis]MBE7133701.1 PhzF family phenazine biosynthesis isomerase [Bacillus paranthracis]MBE7155521.1 PhzF family phenazine biosynthesis isomerase [Bacillus paranthracis]MCU4851459.1 PhzF family phenazine biosynthesis isomerase [Bacillus paranthracis]MDA1888700.1 PhzF family phenazine biosynthesis isomerase [Bacillus cereus group sp. BY11